MQKSSSENVEEVQKCEGNHLDDGKGDGEGEGGAEEK